MKASIWLFCVPRSSCASWVFAVAPISSAACRRPCPWRRRTGWTCPGRAGRCSRSTPGPAAGSASPELQAVMASGKATAASPAKMRAGRWCKVVRSTGCLLLTGCPMRAVRIAGAVCPRQGVRRGVSRVRLFQSWSQGSSRGQQPHDRRTTRSKATSLWSSARYSGVAGRPRRSASTCASMTRAIVRAANTPMVWLCSSSTVRGGSSSGAHGKSSKATSAISSGTLNPRSRITFKAPRTNGLLPATRA